MRLGVEDEPIERERVLVGEDHVQVLEALAHEERLHLVQSLGSDLKKSGKRIIVKIQKYEVSKQANHVNT